jgi:hypothetical protein
MEPFLKQIADAVTKENLPYLYSSCYIFPSKRAAKHFTDFLKDKFISEDFILPETLTIQEFITTYSTYIIKDDWYLLLEIYNIQNTLTNTQQPLEKFMPWGNLILKDFDECDKYLIEAEKLFSVLKAHKEIDETFSISEETRKYIEQFILTTSTQKKESIYKDAFVKTWSLLGEMYVAFKEKLQQNNFAYEGMAYREVYENLQKATLKLPYSKISFCGFNALSVCEEKIFKTIEQQYETEFWWDTDAHFLNNKLHEAGNFLRDYQQKFYGKNHHWIIDDTLTKNKNIEIIGVSSAIGQTQFVAQHFLKDDNKNKDINEDENAIKIHVNKNEKTAIVLCDEKLLNPLLYNIDASNMNITMGFSIAESELFLFTNSLLSFYANARIGKTETDYYHKDIAALSNHLYFKNSVRQKEKLDGIIPYFVPFMPTEILAEFFPEIILKNNSDTIDILKSVLQIIENTHHNDPYFFAIKDKISEHLNTLLQSFQNKNVALDKNALPYIVKQFLATIKVPFDTNTKSNIQIMGFLETRILDFDNLYILSLNDDNLPGTNKTNSFIPYNLRKGFGLPTFEQFDGINAYHFYRLLKRATTIQLIYNNQVGDNSSEKSRFIRQIQHDMNTDTNSITEYIAVIEDDQNPVKKEDQLLQIKKTTEIIEALRERNYSPSSLKIYNQCPLQFYLKYVAKINEPEELVEELDAAVFGQILHKIVELIYQPHLNTILTAEKISSFAKPEFIQTITKQAIIDLKLPKEIAQAGNKLQLKIIERIAQKILENDASVGKLCILKTEEKLVWNELKLEDGNFATIQGTIDRVDKISDKAVRIIDYKTGQIEMPKFPNIDSEESIQKFLDILFIYKIKDFSATFQGILYALMYHKLFGYDQIYVGYHHAKKMKDGIAYLNDQQPIPIELLLQFEVRLSKLVSEIIYKEPFFTQTTNENAYQYSPYADLLGIN